MNYVTMDGDEQRERSVEVSLYMSNACNPPSNSTTAQRQYVAERRIKESA